MARKKVAWLAPPLLCAVLTAYSPPAAAQDAAIAQALFEEGRTLMQQQKFDQACAKFAESQRLGPASGTLLNLGECNAKQGKTASAWAAFKEAIAAAQSAGQKDREAFAKERAAELEGSLMKLTVKVDAETTPQLVVKRDGIVLNRPVWGTAVPVDPGPHVVEASAPGKKPFKATVESSTSERMREVVVPALEDAPVASAGTDKSVLTQRNIGIGVAGVGVVAVAIGSIVGLSAISTNDDAKDHCRDGNLCDQTGLDLLDSARGKATTSTVFFVLGALALGGGAILFFTAPKDTNGANAARPSVRRSFTVSPTASPPVAGSGGSGGIALRGTW